MEVDQLPDHFVYSAKVIDFVTVVAETCLFLEHTSELSESEFVNKSLRLFPLLYLNATLIEITDPVSDDTIERFVTEEDYQFVREQIEQVLGADDSFLEVFHPDMPLSDTPIASFISESIADIYQEIKDFAANYQLADVDIMNDALAGCLVAFGEHWGQKLLNVLRALHAVRFSENFNNKGEVNALEQNKLNRDSFLNFLHRDDEDDLQQLL